MKQWIRNLLLFFHYCLGTRKIKVLPTSDEHLLKWYSTTFSLFELSISEQVYLKFNY